MISSDRKDWLLQRYRIPWETMSTIIGGKSAIDMDRLFITTEESAERFLTNYGYKFTSSAERFELKRIYQKAIEFIKGTFLSTEPGLTMPGMFDDMADLRELLLIVSNDKHPDRAWACAILRVMHTIAHAENSLNEEYFPQIRNQIVDRFQKHIFVDSNGKLFLGEGEERIPLVRWEIKEEKPFDSIVLKLLHKAENVAEDIFDRVGFRIVTETKIDALLTLKYLRSHHIIMFANIKPARSRNTLFDLDNVKKQTDRLYEKLQKDEISEEDFVEQFQAIDSRLPTHELELRKANPFSSESYKSIQFTCRQLIRIHQPIIPHLNLLEELIKKLPEGKEKGQMKNIITNLPLKEIIKFFFPFEIQIMDENSYVENMKGMASHQDYKDSQMQAAKKRVLGSLI